MAERMLGGRLPSAFHMAPSLVMVFSSAGGDRQRFAPLCRSMHLSATIDGCGDEPRFKVFVVFENKRAFEKLYEHVLHDVFGVGD